MYCILLFKLVAGCNQMTFAKEKIHSLERNPFLYECLWNIIHKLFFRMVLPFWFLFRTFNNPSQCLIFFRVLIQRFFGKFYAKGCLNRLQNFARKIKEEMQLMSRTRKDNQNNYHHVFVFSLALELFDIL